MNLLTIFIIYANALILRLIGYKVKKMYQTITFLCILYTLNGMIASGKIKKVHPFDTLVESFQELLTISGGDVSQALRWMNQIDEEHKITHRV
jgi:hypothetical protein